MEAGNVRQVSGYVGRESVRHHHKSKCNYTLDEFDVETTSGLSQLF